MKDVTFEGHARTQDGKPLFIFTVEMHEGRDLSGTFDVQFAALKDNSENVYFALLGRNQTCLATAQYDYDVRELLNDLIGLREMVVAVDYNNLSWEEWDGATAVPILGGAVGEQFDWVETTYLDDKQARELVDLRDTLDREAGLEIDE